MDAELQERLFSQYAGPALSRESEYSPSKKSAAFTATAPRSPKYLDEAPRGLSDIAWEVASASSDDSDVANTLAQRQREEEDRLAREEWEEGVLQLKMAFQLVLIPLIGKWFGRQWSYKCTSCVLTQCLPVGAFQNGVVAAHPT